MKIFLSFRFAGENPEELRPMLRDIRSSLEQAGHRVLWSLSGEDFFIKHQYTHRQILEYALKQLNQSDAVFAFVKSAEKSEGMLLEIGYSLAKGKKFILGIKKGLKTTFMREVADTVIEFETIEDLCRQLSGLS